MLGHFEAEGEVVRPLNTLRVLKVDCHEAVVRNKERRAVHVVSVQASDRPDAVVRECPEPRSAPASHVEYATGLHVLHDDGRDNAGRSQGAIHLSVEESSDVRLLRHAGRSQVPSWLSAQANWRQATVALRRPPAW